MAIYSSSWVTTCYTIKINDTPPCIVNFNTPPLDVHMLSSLGGNAPSSTK